MSAPKLTPETVVENVIATVGEWLPGYVFLEDETGERQYRVRHVGEGPESIQLTYEPVDGTAEPRAFVVGIAVGELA